MHSVAIKAYEMINKPVFNTELLDDNTEDLFYSAFHDSRIFPRHEALGNKSKNTQRHSFSVGMIATIMSVEVGFDKDNSILMASNGLLHDITKADIIDGAIDRLGPLLPNEIPLIRQHPITGYDSLVSTNDFKAQDMLPMLMHHSLQEIPYPSPKNLQSILSVVGLSYESIDETVRASTTILAVADHLEARFPTPYSTHAYMKRDYSVNELISNIRSEFINAGHLRRLGDMAIFNKAIKVGEELCQQVHKDLQTI